MPPVAAAVWMPPKRRPLDRFAVFISQEEQVAMRLSEETSRSALDMLRRFGFVFCAITRYLLTYLMMPAAKVPMLSWHS